MSKANADAKARRNLETVLRMLNRVPGLQLGRSDLMQLECAARRGLIRPGQERDRVIRECRSIAWNSRNGRLTRRARSVLVLLGEGDAYVQPEPEPATAAQASTSTTTANAGAAARLDLVR
jgi:hypothetical protein